MERIRIKRVGNFVELSDPDGGPISESIRTRLHGTFKYQVKTTQFKNRKMSFSFEDMYMLAEYPNGTLAGTYGLVPRLVRWFESNGISVIYAESTPAERNYIHLPPDLSVLDRVTLRHGQKECIEAFLKEKHGVIQAPVGFGKTFLISLLIQMFPKEKFHICTKSRDILQEIYNRLIEVTPNVGIYCGDRKDLYSRVTLITADSLGGLPADDVAFFIFDECHLAAAPTYSRAILDKYRFSRMYGFTATPKGRSDGADDVLSMLFGDIIYSMTYEEGQEAGLVVPISVQWLHCGYSPYSASQWVSKVAQFRHCIWENDTRNRMIADYVTEHCAAQDKVLILVQTVEHAVHLKAVLPEFELVYATFNKDDLAGYIRKGLLPEDYTPLSAKDRKRMQDDFKSGRIRRVIATSVWNTGVDFPDLKYVVNAGALSSLIVTTQGGGRASRVSTGKTSAVVVDVVDEFDGKNSSFYRSSQARKKVYDELGWKNTGWTVRR